MTKLKLSLAAIGTFTVLFLMSCNKQEYQSFEELDNINIREYIEKNNLSVTQYKQTNLFYQVLKAGTGRPIDFKETYPIVYTIKTLDGGYQVNDTLSSSSRYADFFGYFPYGSAYAGMPNSPVERTEDFKEVIKEVLQRTDGTIRIIVPSRLTVYGRNGNRNLGISPNSSMDYVVSIYDNFDDYEDAVMRNSMSKAGLQFDRFTKTASNIYYEILEPGDGHFITADSTVNVNYTLRRPDASVMESADSARVNLAGSIAAWQEIVPLVRKGGKIRAFIPSKQAYGHAGSPAQQVPPFLSLDYEIKVNK